MVAIGIGVGVVFGGAVSEPFSPLDLSPALWLDASDTSTITASSGAVSEWRDKSGNARHVSQGTAANQPTTASRTQNGLNVIDFDGGDFLNGGDILDVGSGGITAVGVAKFDTSGDGALWGKSLAGVGAGRWSLLRASGSLLWLFSDGVSGSYSAPSVIDTTTTPRLFTHRVTRNASGGNALRIDRTAVGTAANTSGTATHDTSNEFFVGAYQSGTGTTPPTAGLYLDGFVAEVVVCLSTLSDSDRDKLEDYLATKWGL